MARQTSSKTWILIGGLVMAAGLVLYFGFGIPPTDEVAGTIAPAERYRGEQITEEDLGLGDTGVVSLMQTDAFEMMVNDPQFQALASDPGFQALMSSQPSARARSTSAYCRR